MAGNESQWPAQHPGEGWYADPQGPGTADDGPPTAAPEQATAEQAPAAPPVSGQAPPAWAKVSPAAPSSPAPSSPAASPYGPPAAPYGHQLPSAASYAWPPAPHIPPGGYQVLPGSYPFPPGGYPAPQGGYPVPQGGYQAQAQMSSGMMNPGMRAAAADRERAVDVLKAGFAEGRLTQEEYNHRMGQAYAAKTYGELAALTADLPAGAMPAVWPMPMYQPPVTTNSLARASLVLGVAEFFTMGLTAIPAIICGHMAKREMRQTGQRGDGLATSGLVLGYMAVIFWGILIALSIVSVVITSSTGTGG